MRQNASTPATLRIDDLVFDDLRQFPRSTIPDILHTLSNLERKVFPSSEVFPFDNSLVAKQNTLVLVGCSRAACPRKIVAYAVCVRWHHRLLLHKICVAPDFRLSGTGSKLMEKVIEHARRWSCRGIDLWVDEGNHGARCLYSKYDFLIQETVQDYYSPGRNGIKMSRALEH
jgi:ribosomal protein S18 acetylase RimI-like enzyme